MRRRLPAGPSRASEHDLQPQLIAARGEVRRDAAAAAVRPVPRAPLQIGADIAWARWLPGGRQLLADGIASAYVVMAATFGARPLTFRGRPEPVSYSAVVPRASRRGPS